MKAELRNLNDLTRTFNPFRSLQVPVPALRQWLVLKKSEGYSLLGLEQTQGSVSMPEFDFPRRSVLVLGEERHGIPAPILELLDFFIEIPQLGLIRSLNVHVSGALALYEYTRQHGLKK